jgi:DNA ligase-1
MLTGDLGEIARIALAEGAEGLRAVSLQLLRPLKPMLVASSESVEAAIVELGEAFVEWKLDGARIQVHRLGEEVRIFTRNLNDVTARLPEVVASIKALTLDALVLDGEAMTLSGDARPVPFQDSMSRFGRDEEHVSEMTAFYFDCLHLDGRDLIDAPLRERRAALEEVVGTAATPGRMIVDESEARAFLDVAIAAGHEGVMVKELDVAYQAGRRGKAWRKVKPVVTVDLVVLAADWGHGRRRGWLSNLHLGARADTGEIVMVGKTFKGMTDELLERQTRELQEREVAREGITVFVREELVVEIALDGVQRSTRYPGGVALRFARVKRYRRDKAPADATTIDELRGLLAWPRPRGPLLPWASCGALPRHADHPRRGPRARRDLPGDRRPGRELQGWHRGRRHVLGGGGVSRGHCVTRAELARGEHPRAEVAASSAHWRGLAKRLRVKVRARCRPEPLSIGPVGLIVRCRRALRWLSVFSPPRSGLPMRPRLVPTVRPLRQ